MQARRSPPARAFPTSLFCPGRSGAPSSRSTHPSPARCLARAERSRPCPSSRARSRETFSARPQSQQSGGTHLQECAAGRSPSGPALGEPRVGCAPEEPNRVGPPTIFRRAEGLGSTLPFASAPRDSQALSETRASAADNSCAQFRGRCRAPDSSPRHSRSDRMFSWRERAPRCPEPVRGARDESPGSAGAPPTRFCRAQRSRRLRQKVRGALAFRTRCSLRRRRPSGHLEAVLALAPATCSASFPSARRSE